VTLRTALATLIVAWLGVATAHATLVFGELTVIPDPPEPGSPVELVVTLEDPSVTPIEDAVVALEFRRLAEVAAETSVGATETAPLRSVNLVETSPAVYTGDVTLPDTGAYQVRVRDNTFAAEEATAAFVLELDDRPVGALPFILPPTQVGPQGLATWLLWLIGVPVVAGVVVTVLVLSSPKTTRGDGDAPPDERA
jgi:hypothetical protein